MFFQAPNPPLPPPPAGAVYMVSVDQTVEPPALVRVNTATGVVRVIGPIAPAATVPFIGPGTVEDMEFVGGRLFALITRYPTSADLVELDPETAEAMSVTRLTYNSATLANAATSLAGNSPLGDSPMVVAFWLGASEPSVANALGRTPPPTVPPQVPPEETAVSFLATTNISFSGLASVGTGTLVAFQRQPVFNRLDLLRVQLNPLSVQNITSQPFTTVLSGARTPAVIPGLGPIWTVDPETKQIVRFNADGSLQSNRGYDPAYTLWTVAICVRCTADYNADGLTNPDDLGDYITDFFAVPPVPGPGGFAVPGSCPLAESPVNVEGLKADINHDCQVNTDDLTDYITAYFMGC